MLSNQPRRLNEARDTYRFSKTANSRKIHRSRKNKHKGYEIEIPYEASQARETKRISLTGNS